MLPCNVVVTEAGPDNVEVSAVDPVASMYAVDSAALAQVAGKVSDQLKDMIADL